MICRADICVDCLVFLCRETSEERGIASADLLCSKPTRTRPCDSIRACLGCHSPRHDEGRDSVGLHHHQDQCRYIPGRRRGGLGLVKVHSGHPQKAKQVDVRIGEGDASTSHPPTHSFIHRINYCSSVGMNLFPMCAYM